MADELSYVIINPYTLSKSRTGGVLSRLLTRTALDLAGAMMFTPSQALVDAFAATIPKGNITTHEGRLQELLRIYVKTQLPPDVITGKRKRFMVFLFRGQDAVRRTSQAVGDFRLNDQTSGECIRETYGDYITNDDGSVRYFEPAVITGDTLEETANQLNVLREFAATDGGVLAGVVPSEGQLNHQKTLVVIKPDNFKFPNGRPGSVIDLFSRTGLCITGIKVHRMSVAEAQAFYAPVRISLREKLGHPAARRAAEWLQNELGLNLDEETVQKIGTLLGPVAGEARFAKIIRFMTGRDPGAITSAQREEPGDEKCVAIIYEGIDAVRKIREVLGPTDPSKAPPGSIRREFGQSMLDNAAHASDAPESAARELEIVRIQDNTFTSIIESFYRN